MTTGTPDGWDAFLGLFTADEVEELGNRFADAENDHERCSDKPIVMPSGLIVPSPLQVEALGAKGDYVEVTMGFHESMGKRMLDAWTHYIDHDCEDSEETLDLVLGLVMDAVGDALFGEIPDASIIAHGDLYFADHPQQARVVSVDDADADWDWWVSDEDDEEPWGEW